MDPTMWQQPWVAPALGFLGGALLTALLMRSGRGARPRKTEALVARPAAAPAPAAPTPAPARPAGRGADSEALRAALEDAQSLRGRLAKAELALRELRRSAKA